MTTLALLCALMVKVWKAGGPALEKIAILAAALLVARIVARSLPNAAI